MLVIDLSRLRNNECVSLNRQYLEIVEANDPVALDVQPEFDAFRLSATAVDSGFLVSQKSPLTAKIEALDMLRDRYISGLLKNIESHRDNPDAGKVSAATLLADKLAIYGNITDIVNLSLLAETAQIDSMVKDLLGKPELQAAATTLGIVSWINEVDRANRELDALYLERTRETAKTGENANLKTLRSIAEEDFKALHTRIESMLVARRGAEPWKTTVTQLDALIEQYRNLLARRRGGKDDEDQTGSDNQQ